MLVVKMIKKMLKHNILERINEGITAPLIKNTIKIQI